MFKRTLTFLGNVFGWILISLIFGAFIFFFTILIMLFAGLPILNLISEDLIDPIMDWWMNKGPYICCIIAFILTIIVENHHPLFPKKTDPPRDRA